MRTFILWAGLLLIAFESSAYAKNSPLPRSHEQIRTVSAASLDKASSDGYWTPERLKNAKPRTPSVSVDQILNGKRFTKSKKSASGKAEGPTVTNPRRPGVRVKPDTENRLFVPETENQRPREKSEGSNRVKSEATFTPQNMGTRRAHFTSSRLIPLSADLQYPYKAVGKLFFTDPGVGAFMCSAAVIKPRIILTAGHCVHSGRNGDNGYFTNFLFVPAFRDGIAPFQRWSWEAVIAHPTWTQGGGAVPNAADYALIELEDRPFGGALKRIGMVTGWLGVKIRSLHPNHAHLLGYPANLDRGLKMHQVAAGSFGVGGNNTVIYGSDMGTGSSGGPWVQNFQSLAIGQSGGGNPGSKLIIGVTSYTAASMGPRYEGSSILDSRFTALLNVMCANRPGNC